MQNPMVFLPATTVPPLHVWPRPLKNLLLYTAILAVILSYLLLGTGIITLSIMALGEFGG